MKKYASPHLGYFDVVEACREPGCPICRLSRQEVKKYLDAILYDCVTDPDIRDVLRASQGYCHTHGWQLSTVGRGYLLGISILYDDVLDVVGNDIRKLKPGSARGHPLTRLFSGKQAAPDSRPRCPACLVVEEVEAMALKLLCQGLSGRDDGMVEALNASDGLCLQHLRQAFTSFADRTAGDMLLASAQQRIDAIRAGLQEFIRKNDHRFQHEPVGAERESWKQALTFLVGPQKEGERELD